MNKFIKVVLILLSLCLIIVPVTYASILYMTTKGAIDQSFSNASKQSKLRQKAVDPALDHISILFLGIDDSLSRRKNGQTMEEARTDAMILATFNRDDKQVRLVSIPRDTLSYIPSVGYYDKITHAHAEGGPKSSMETVEHIFNTPVDFYVRINMQAFVDIIDELGGIEFDVPFDIDEPSKTDKGRTKLKAGRQLVNGEEALALVRSRHVDTDLGRGRRQMEMIEAIVKKAKDTNSLSKLDELVKIVGNNAKHNLTFDNIKSLASEYSSNDVHFKRHQLKGTDLMYNGVYYYNPDLDHIYSISKLLRKDLGLESKPKQSLLDYKMEVVYGDLIPLEKINLDTLEKDYKKHKNNKDLKPKTPKVEQNNDEQNTNNVQNSTDTSVETSNQSITTTY